MSSTKHKPNPFGMIVLVTVVLGLTTLLRMLANDSKLILHLFYLPIACGGLFLGRTRTIILAVIAACSVVLVQTESLWLGTSSGSVVYVGVYPNFHALLHTGIWSLTLLLTATIIGTLSDEWLRTLNRLQESHRVDTMRDSLTKIANRRAFEMELVSRVADWEQQGIPVGLLLVDVDHFKRFNDTYGHQAGDAILQQVAETLKSSMRDIDIVARYGGEEFAIVLTSTSVEKAKLAGERVRSVIEQRRFNYEGLNLRLTVSVGMSHSLPKDTMSTLIERADAALYASKQNGRNCAHYQSGIGCERFGASLTPVDSDHELSNCVEDNDISYYADRVTGLPTRRVFLEELRRRVSESQRYEYEMSLMVVLVDKFDDIKTRGSKAEEFVLGIVAEFIRTSLRDPDLVSRYSNNEFSVLLPATPLNAALIPAERIRNCAAEFKKARFQGETLEFTVSIGIASLRHDDNSMSLMERAHSAAKLAAEEVGNCAVTDDGNGKRQLYNPATANEPVAIEA